MNNHEIEMVEKLKILGSTFSSNYIWKDHPVALKNSLIARFNIIRYLANKTVIRINILPYLTKNSSSSETDYDLHIFSKNSKSSINIIKPICHQAIRARLYAFKTTPINNLLKETGLPPLENRIHYAKARILPKLLSSTNSVIDQDNKSILNSKRPKRFKSVISY